MRKGSEHLAVHVVVVGGGFGGRYAAKRLAYRLPAGSSVTLVDRNDYMLYTPMLTEAAGRSVSLQHVQAPNHALPRRVKFVQGELKAADLRKKTITLASGQIIAGDHLLFALGSTTNYHHVEGAETYTLSMKTLDDARRVCTLAQHNVQQAAGETDPEVRKRLLSFIVAGGGYTGVETIAALNDLVRDTAHLHKIPMDQLQLTIVEPMDRLMAEMPQDLALYAHAQLEKSGVRVRSGAGVKRVEENSLTLTNDEDMSAGMLIWDTGIRPNPLVDSFDCAKGKKGGIAVDSTFRVPDREGIWAIGDCAEIPKPEGGGFFEPTAQNATREGTHVAENILASIHGRKLRPFTYKQIGELAVVSRHGGVANVFGLHFRGVVAWLMWRAIYVAKMPNMQQRFGLVWDYIRLAFGRKYVPVSRQLPGSADSGGAIGSDTRNRLLESTV